MSIVVQRFPACDNCGESFPDYVGYDNAYQLRLAMRNEGWKLRKGKDYCPECRKILFKDK